MILKKHVTEMVVQKPPLIVRRPICRREDRREQQWIASCVGCFSQPFPTFHHAAAESGFNRLVDAFGQLAGSRPRKNVSHFWAIWSTTVRPGARGVSGRLPERVRLVVFGNLWLLSFRMLISEARVPCPLPRLQVWGRERV
jgi:hypothetical protein